MSKKIDLGELEEDLQYQRDIAVAALNVLIAEYERTLRNIGFSEEGIGKEPQVLLARLALSEIDRRR